MTSSVASSVIVGLADAALRALVFAGVMGLALLVCRVTSAAAKLWAWTIVLGVAIAMPLLGRAVPGLRLAIPAIAPIERVLQWAAAAAPAGADGHAAGAGVSAPRADGGTDRADASSVTGAFPAMSMSWPVGLLAVYVAGVLLLLARAARSWRATRRLERGARVVHDRTALDRLQRHAAAAGLSHVPRLVESSALRVPVTMSVTQPTIALPWAWREWSPATFDAVLAHETAHVARRDTLTQRGSLVYRAVAWFSPLSWWLHHELAELAEQASDESALAAGADRTDYAETLLAFFAELKHQPRRADWHVAMARGAVASAERRVDRILQWKGDRAMRLTRRFTLGMLVVAVPLAVVTAAMHPTVVLSAAPNGPASVATAPAPIVASRADANVPTASQEPVIYRPGNGVTDPVPLKQPEPHYTSGAARARIQGEVELQAIIQPDGTVGTVKVTKSLDTKYGLDQEAIKAAKQWSFRPATRDGKPVNVQVTLVMTFRVGPEGEAPAQARSSDPGPVELRREAQAQLAAAAAQTPDDDFVRGTYPEDTPGLVPPRVTYWPEPKYTSDAMRAKIQGQVILDAVVGVDGTVLRIRVAQSLDKDYGLDDEALKAAKQWLFEPGTLNGRKVPVLVKLALTFRLH